MGTKRLTNEQKERIRKKQRNRRIRRILYAVLFVAVLLTLGVGVVRGIQRSRAQKNAEKAEKEAAISEEEATLEAHRAAVKEADVLAAQYDYDGAIEHLKAIEHYDSDSELIDAIARYTVAKTTLTAVDPTQVPHIFFHSLIVDKERAFDVNRWGESEVAGINAWMTTVDEFDRIMQQMYDNGYVLVRMRDLVTETKNEDGTVTFSPNRNLMLPPDKHAFVLSIDDWSYYHSYTGKGYGEKAVLDANGDVKIRYTDADGQVTVGDYDVVPRLNAFIKEHPDFSYKGARGLIAMTGYNGVFGYRTDIDYVKQERLQEDQRAWLNEHPGFDEAARQSEIAEATKIAEACKAEGWEFASHTWGHLSVTGKDAATLQADNERWLANVGNIVGETDTIIFAHGNDIGDWHDYDAATNPVYAYYKSAGYNFYANVDASSKAWVQIRSQYCRQGRIDCDGLQMWRALSGSAKINVFEDLFDVESVFDKDRPTPVSASGKA